MRLYHIADGIRQALGELLGVIQYLGIQCAPVQ